MKIAVLSDIHGNVAALEAVAAHIEGWQPDHIIVNGDVVNRGPDSVACWQIIKAQQESAGWQVLSGNHETYVCKHANPVPDREHVGVRAAINQNSRWTYRQFNGQVAELVALTAVADVVAPDGSRLRATHASMRSNSDGIYPFYTDEAIQAQIDTDTAVFVTSHIHVAYTRQINGTLLVNSGSAGQMCDGDTRASYAQIVWRKGQWRAEIVRLPYDTAATERAFLTSGFMDETGPVAQLIFHEWRTAVSFLTPWRAAYMTAVLSGDISLEQSVAEFLQKQGVL